MRPHRVLHPRTLAGGASLGLLLVILVAGAALAAGPDHTRYDEPETILYEDLCAFPILLQDRHASLNELVFPPGDTAQQVVYTGSFVSTLTNTETKATMQVSISNRLAFQFATDGSVEARSSGSALVYYGAADAAASQLGQGVFLVRGTTHESYDTTGTLTRATYTGSVLDLCARLGD